MTRWRLTVEYDGTPFLGWQRQNQAPTVQETLEDALAKMTGERAAFTAGEEVYFHAMNTIGKPLYADRSMLSDNVHILDGPPGGVGKFALVISVHVAVEGLLLPS